MSARKSEGLSPLFQYQHVRDSMNRFAAQCEGDFSEAWEDFEIACRGRGGAGISGAVFELWQNLPKRKDNAFLVALAQGFSKAHENTDSRYLRYRPNDRNAPLRTLEEGFSDPEADPNDIPIPAEVKKFALTSGIQTIEFNPPPEVSDSIPKKANASPFTVIQGGRGGESST